MYLFVQILSRIAELHLVRIIIVRKWTSAVFMLQCVEMKSLERCAPQHAMLVPYKKKPKIPETRVLLPRKYLLTL